MNEVKGAIPMGKRIAIIKMNYLLVLHEVLELVLCDISVELL